MPYNSFSLEVDHTDQAQESFRIESGFLEAVTLGPTRTGSGNAEFYGQILLASTEIPTPVTVALLASGYFGASVAISWTGRIRMEPTFAIVARIWSASAIPIRCDILTDIGG